MQDIAHDGNGPGRSLLHSPAGAALALAGCVFAACLFGIHTRPVGFLANVWPANAIMLAILLRNPASASPAGWLAGAAAYMAADLLTGSSLFKAAILNAANLAGIAAAWAICARLPRDMIRFRHPASMLYLGMAAAVAGFCAGIVGGFANPVIFGGGILRGWAFWCATEFVNYIAILPVLLSLPPPGKAAPAQWLRDRRRPDHAALWKNALPAGALFLSCLAAAFVGGPGAIAFPAPALLWCGLVYAVFPTALLTLLYSLWVMIVVSNGYLPDFGGQFDEMALVSIRLGASLIALAPVMLSGIMRNRDELLARLHDLATRDRLTGLHNRAAFHDEAGRLLARHGRGPAAMLMIDLDHFKAVNDTYGHAGGDAVLAGFAERLRHCLRQADLPGRLGGEEFAVLLPDCAPADAIAIAGRIREEAGRAPVALDDGRGVSVTVSIGVAMRAEAMRDGEAASPERLLREADAALYRAKNNGRNRVEIAVTGDAKGGEEAVAAGGDVAEHRAADPAL